MKKEQLIEEFKTLSLEDKNIILPILGKETPNPMNSGDHYLVATWTFLSNVITNYKHPKGPVSKEQASSHIINYIEEWFV